jgi:hypothetical protein
MTETVLIPNRVDRLPERHRQAFAPLLGGVELAAAEPVAADPVPQLEPRISKRALADHYGMSTRWVEQRMSEGLPHEHMDGRARFVLAEADAWLREHGHLKAAAV